MCCKVKEAIPVFGIEDSIYPLSVSVYPVRRAPLRERLELL
jgi:hypothetical protein